MKKLFTVLSFGTMLALSAVSYKSGSSLDLSKIAPEAEKSTYRITVAGDVKKNPYQARIEKNRVLNEIKYRLPADSYAITYDYDTLFNGFAIEVKNDAASEILKQITGVKSVELSHRYAAPEETSSFGTEDDGVSTKNASTSVYNQNKELKLKNYSAETRRVTKDILGSDAKRGKGIKIGIMDTGLYLNQVEGTSQRTSLEQNPPKENGKSLLNAAAFKDLSNDEVASDGWHTKRKSLLGSKTKTELSKLRISPLSTTRFRLLSMLPMVTTMSILLVVLRTTFTVPMLLLYPLQMAMNSRVLLRKPRSLSSRSSETMLPVQAMLLSARHWNMLLRGNSMLLTFL